MNKYTHPRKHPNAMWRMRLSYDLWQRYTGNESVGITMCHDQALRTPFRRLGDKRSVHLWRRQVLLKVSKK